MRKLILILASAACVLGANAQKVASYEEFTQRVVTNNPALKALQYTLEAQKSSNRVGITPSDPRIETNPMSSGDTEITTSIDFLFPTIYFQMKKAAKFATQKNEYEYYVAQFETLQSIDQAYIDYVYATKKLHLLDQIVESNQKALNSIELSLESGNSTRIDLNVANMVLARSKTNQTQVKTEITNVLARITALNGGLGLEFDQLDYPLYDVGDMDSYVDRAYERSYNIKISQADSLVATQNVRLNKHSWAPNISAGYKTVIGSSGTSIGGVIVGISIPLWENSHKVDAAKKQYSAAVENNRNNRLQVISQLESLKNDYITSSTNYELYHDMLTRQSTIKLLTAAMEGGQLEVVDYYSEVNTLIEIYLTMLEFQYNSLTLLSRMQSLLY